MRLWVEEGAAGGGLVLPRPAGLGVASIWERFSCRMARTEEQAACMAVTSADILLQRAWILPFLKMTKLARKEGFVKSLRSILKLKCVSEDSNTHVVGRHPRG